MSGMEYPYEPGASMGHPRMVSMADAAGDLSGRVVTHAAEQIAYELRTANLIQYLRDNGALDPAYAHIMNEIRSRLGITGIDSETAA